MKCYYNRDKPTFCSIQYCPRIDHYKKNKDLDEWMSLFDECKYRDTLEKEAK